MSENLKKKEIKESSSFCLFVSFLPFLCYLDDRFIYVLVIVGPNLFRPDIFEFPIYLEYSFLRVINVTAYLINVLVILVSEKNVLFKHVFFNL